MDKKAQIFFAGPQKIFFYLIVVAIALIMILTLQAIFKHYNSMPVTIPAYLESDLIWYRIINSDCFLLKDVKTNRLIKVADWEKFNQETMDSCIIAGEKAPQFLLTLALGESEKKIKTSNFKGSSKSVTKQLSVFKDNKISKGELKIET